MTTSGLNPLQLKYLVLQSLQECGFHSTEDVCSEVSKNTKKRTFVRDVKWTLKQLTKNGLLKVKDDNGKEVYLLRPSGKRKLNELMEYKELYGFDGLQG